MTENEQQPRQSLAQKIKAAPAGKKIRFLLILIAAAAVLAIYTTTLAPAGAGGDLEGRMSAALGRVEGAGRVEVVVNEEPRAVVIVAEGADDIGVRIRLLKAAKSLLGIDADRVEVLPMAKGEK